MHDLNKRIPPTEYNRIEVKNVYILVENNMFWFETDFEGKESHVNVNKPFLHVHKGITSRNELTFENEPHLAEKIEYNPKTRQIEIGRSRLPWRKLKYKRRASHVGHTPKNRIAVRKMYYDYSNRFFYFIINYFPTIPKVGFRLEKCVKEELLHADELENIVTH